MTSKAMTNGERFSLERVVKMRAEVLRGNVKAKRAEMLADVEARLSQTYQQYEEAWKGAVLKAQEAISAVNEQVKETLAAEGVPVTFMPSMVTMWMERGESAWAGRRNELRKRAEARITAGVEAAVLKVSTWEADTMTKLLATSLSSEEAAAFLAALPSIDDIMLSFEVKDLEALPATASDLQHQDEMRRYRSLYGSL
jgi:hypothetical protein